MKKFLSIICLLGALHVLWGQQVFNPIQSSDRYKVWQNLTAMQNDQLPMEIVPPVLQEDTAEFHIPRIIPGTYDVHNYGRFISDFYALSAQGDTLPVKRLDTNRWQIAEAQKLYKIGYKAGDTYDAENPNIFEPAGTSLEDSVFLLNNFGYIGYIAGHKKTPYTLKVKKPKGFYGSTAMSGTRTDTLDTYEIADYFSVHDNPILYCKADTATKMVQGTEVVVSVYSPNGKVTADKSMQRISEVLDAAGRYLGKLPVEKYAVLIYCVPLNQAGSSYGALEHHRSTVLYMPEFGGERFYSGVRDITSHEFFHIVTPLRIHSQHVANFDFINPEMSEHIWLFEGVTEYNSHLVQKRSGIYSMDEFMDVLKNKMKTADGFNQDIPLTQASKHTLSFFKDQYYNFYQKGALAGMALDLKLIELSDGKYRLIDLLDELGRTYGMDSAFKDANLFDIITEMTYPEMREFFARYYASAESLPLQELLENVGITYKAEQEIEKLSTGGVEYGYNFETERVKVENVDEMDAFGRALGYQKGDELVEFNGEEVTLDNISEVLSDFYENTEPGDKVKIEVMRKDEDGEYDDEKLKAEAQVTTATRKNVLKVQEDISEKQRRLREAWIGKKQ